MYTKFERLIKIFIRSHLFNYDYENVNCLKKYLIDNGTGGNLNETKKFLIIRAKIMNTIIVFRIRYEDSSRNFVDSHRLSKDERKSIKLCQVMQRDPHIRHAYNSTNKRLTNFSSTPLPPTIRISYRETRSTRRPGFTFLKDLSFR